MKRQPSNMHDGVEYLAKDGEVDLLILHRNKRYEESKGTRIASMVRNVNPRIPVQRKWAEQHNRQDLIKAWEKQWGPIEGRTYSVRHTHLTIQVVTELAVWPDD